MINPLTGAVVESFTTAVRKAVEDPVTPAVVPVVSVNPLTEAVVAAYDTAAPVVQETMATATTHAQEMGFRAAAPTMYAGMRESAVQWRNAMIARVDDIKKVVDEKLDGESFANHIKDAVENVRSFFTESILFAPVVLATGVAAEFQGDMLRTAQLAGGLYSEGFERAERATLRLFTSQALTQDQASEIIQVLTALNPVLGVTDQHYESLGQRAADLVHVFDFSWGRGRVVGESATPDGIGGPRHRRFEQIAF